MSRNVTGGCKTFDPTRLAEYRDGVMSRKDSLEFERHLSECVSCREALRGLHGDLYRFESAAPPRRVGYRKESVRRTMVKMSPAGFSKPTPVSGCEIRPVYAAEAAGPTHRLACGLKFVLDSATITLIQKGPRSARLTAALPARQKKLILEITRKGSMIAGAPGRVAADLDRKGGYEIRSSGRILFSIRLS